LYTWVLVHDLFDFYTIVQTFVKKVQGCSVKNTYGRIIEHSLLSRTDSLFLETCILSYEPDILIVIYFWTMEGLYCYANHKNIAS
jgi:hypothetical protein